MFRSLEMLTCRGRGLAAAWTTSRLAPWALMAALAVALLPTHGATAQEASATTSRLRQQVEKLYTVEATPRGLALVPRESRFGVRRIEIVGDTIAINGAKVPREVLRSWLGEESQWILAVADLGQARRRGLFDLPFDGSTEPLAAEGNAEGNAESNEELPAPAQAEERVLVVAEEGSEAGDPEVSEDPAVPRLGDDQREEIEPSQAPRPPRPPQRPRHQPRHRRGDEVTLFRNLVIPAGESVRDAVSVMGSVVIEGEVRGDVTAVMGSVTVDGLVEGEVVAVGGSVIVNEGGEITRDATSVGGRVERHGSGKVRGSIVEVPFLGSWNRGRGVNIHIDRGTRNRRHSWWNGWWEFFWFGVWLAFCALVSSIVVLIGPRWVARTAEHVRREWWKAGLVGCLAILVCLPALAILVVVLSITLIGIPVAVILVLLTPFLIFLTWLLGMVGVARRLGEWTLAQVGRSAEGDYAPVLWGILTLASFDLVGSLFDFMAVGLRWFRIPAALCHGLGGFIWVVAGVVGIGAVLLMLIDRRRNRSSEGYYPPASYARTPADGLAADRPVDPAPSDGLAYDPPEGGRSDEEDPDPDLGFDGDKSEG